MFDSERQFSGPDSTASRPELRRSFPECQFQRQDTVHFLVEKVDVLVQRVQFFTLRAPAEARPEARIRKSLFFLVFLGIFGQKLDF